MNEPQQHDDALRDDALREVLHHAVDHVRSSPDLAQRAERAAKHLRSARRRATGALALAAVATAGVLTAGGSGTHHGGAQPSSTLQAKLPACASHQSAYRRSPASSASTGTTAPTGPVVPGSPAAAVVCRYAEDGDLAASAKVADPAQVSRLQSAMNASQGYTGGLYCLAAGLNAVVLFTYPQGTDDFTVTYDAACASLYTNAGSYLVRGDVYQLITAWTGSWQTGAGNSAD